jgi:hypothetical protein
VIERKLEERIEMTSRRGRRRKELLDDLKEKRKSGKEMLEIERGSNKSQCVENSLCKGLRTCLRQTTA